MTPRFRRRDPQDYAPGQAEGGQYDDPKPVPTDPIMVGGAWLSLFLNADRTYSVKDDGLWLTAEGWSKQTLERARFDTRYDLYRFMDVWMQGHGRLVGLLSKKKAKKMKSKENANADGT